ncbi:MAG: tetratricopeptide repeat protein, partial [Methanomassiliicoccaceae archaeon]|nr:tetratricopeptide repeat protein [Methanomassiliicoccaceae archaeon]
MGVPEDHFPVTHGKLTVNVPRNLFTLNGVFVDEKRAVLFRETLKGRYPWLTDNSIDVLIENARRMVMSEVDEETNGRSVSKVLESQGKIEEAIRHLEKHLEKDPENADTWYALGELLCKSGRAE